MANLWPPSRFWQYWALAGMVVLTAAFWWSVEGYAVTERGGPHGPVAEGLIRFSLLILTPALVLVWLAAAWLRRRVGEAGYWQFLAIVAMIWTGTLLVVHMVT